MIKIKAMPLKKFTQIADDELMNAIHSLQSGKRIHPFSPVSDNHQYLLGTPYFNLNFKKEILQFIPVGQYKPGLSVLRKTHNKQAMIAELRSEYRSIAEALVALDIKFRVVDLEKGDREMGRWLRRKGCLSLQLPYEQIIHWQLFPRDMWVLLKEVNILLVHPNLFNIPSSYLNGFKIFHSKWGEGGQALQSGDRIVLGCPPVKGKRIHDFKVISQLTEAGMKVAFIPYALFYGLSPRGETKLLFHHSHIDLSASLLRGRDGGFHLILDPQYRTGALADPLPVAASIDLVRKKCDEIEVEVHVPRKGLSIPFATAMIQFENGKVLAAKGDDEILGIAAEIAGAENIKITDVPIVQYPIFGGAGLHCLVTENPLPLISALV
jgi:hypothetical protein